MLELTQNYERGGTSASLSKILACMNGSMLISQYIPGDGVISCREKNDSTNR
jgi:hypothetical protein